DTWNSGLTVSEINSTGFGVDIAAINVGANNTAYIDHVQVIIYYTEAGTLIQNTTIIRPNGDVTSEWESSHAGSHSLLINETTIDANDFIYTSSLASANNTDEFYMSSFDTISGIITQLQIVINGEEVDVSSSIDVYCGSWLGEKQLEMSGVGNYTYTWSGLSLTQTDLDNMKIKFESEPPPGGEIKDYDYVDFGDSTFLDDALGISVSEFGLSAWIYPTSLTSYQSSNGIKNVFISKSGNIEIGISQTGFLQLWLNTTNVETYAEYGFPGAVALNSWQYISVRYNESGNNVDVLIGDIWCREAIGATQEPWSGGGALIEGGNFTVGAELTSYSGFVGKLDDISVFN
ncbi:hypothetical protein LCGC14_3092870, partial [marine sediment metagenome]